MKLVVGLGDVDRPRYSRVAGVEVPEEGPRRKDERSEVRLDLRGKATVYLRLDMVRDALRTRHKRRRTALSYVGWILFYRGSFQVRACA